VASEECGGALEHHENGVAGCGVGELVVRWTISELWSVIFLERQGRVGWMSVHLSLVDVSVLC
jgi:hypothetical protein